MIKDRIWVWDLWRMVTECPQFVVIAQSDFGYIGHYRNRKHAWYQVEKKYLTRWKSMYMKALINYKAKLSYIYK